MKKIFLTIITLLAYTSSSYSSTPYLGLECGFLKSEPKNLEVEKSGFDLEIKYFQNFQTENWSFDPGLGLIYLTAEGSNMSRDVEIKTTALDLNLDAKYRLTEKIAVGPAYKGLFGTDTTLVEEKQGSSYFNSLIGIKGDYLFTKYGQMPIKLEAGIFSSISNRSTTLVNLGIAFGFPSSQEKKIEDLNKIVVPRSVPSEIPREKEYIVQEEIADVKITLKSARVLFNTDVSQLDPDLSLKIEKLGVYLANNSQEWTRVKVSGHTDMTGGKEYNQQLSQSRAESVMNALVNSGVPSSKISAIGYGWSRPLDTSNSQEAYSKNRRTEIEFFGVKDKEKFNQILLTILK